MALQLCKSKHRSLGSPPLIHLFSTSQNDNNGDSKDDNNNSSSSRSSSKNSSNYSLNSYFSDVKASLRQQAPPKQTKSSSYSSSVPSKVASIEEIRKNLAEFRQRSAMPPPSTEPNPTAFPLQSHSHPHSQHVSFQEFFKKNEYNEAVSSKSSGKISLDTIRESLRQMRAVNANNKNRGSMGNSEDRFSLKPFQDTLKMRREIVDANRAIGGTQELPAPVFRKETSAEDKAAEQERMKTEFVKMYTVKELGEKLRKLRPEGLEGGFSFQELNKRLMRLREMEEKESSLQFGGVVQALKESLHTLSMEGEHKAKAQRVKLLESFGGTPEYLQHPPKDHLVEKYFHLENMSSAEKIKIELAKVRDEFKMSESDCGSARVQIAQLTTKIKHLSLALHKKDKHSRKGLQGMVQRRKRLLKYLRRTDWDSYCFVLSKLGLRDNPDYKSFT